MVCKKCGCENPIIKKTCQQCDSILEGETINNVTGEIGYRNADGSFTIYKDGKIEIKGKLPTLKQQIDLAKSELIKELQSVLDKHIEKTGIPYDIKVTYINDESTGNYYSVVKLWE